VDYRLESDGAGEWRVTVTGHGFEPAAGPIRLDLENWGEWREVDSYYFRLLSLEPAPAEQLPSLLPPFELQALTPGGGFRLQYALRPALLGSAAQSAHGLLPFRAPTYECGQSLNVFLRVRQGESPAPAASVELVPPEGAGVFSGWGGASAGAQRAAVDPSAWNGIFAFGQTRAARTYGGAAAPIHVWQFGAAKDVTETVGVNVELLAAAMGAAMGRPAPNPMHVFVMDAGDGGMAAARGFVVGYRASTPDFHQFSPYFAMGVAHELFHNWLGIELPASEEIAWFHEGFTDYLALWFMAATGVCQRTWLADRLLELEAEALDASALGEVAFADPDVTWRDHDGRLERMAYQGGALLAFRLDVELRAAGKPGLPAMIADFLREGGEPTLERIGAWIEAQGLEGFYDKYVAGTALPETAQGLELAGFRLEQRAVPLTYLGIEAEGDGLGARILSVDPAGPAAQAGLQPGDVVTGYAPNRDGAVSVEDGLPTHYRFGLTLLAPAAKSAQLWVQRGGSNVEVRIVPRAMSGGLERKTAAPEASVDDFFRFEPPAAAPAGPEPPR